MYDHPAQQAANDAFWAWIAVRLAAMGLPGVPQELDRSRSPEAAWQDPQLLLGQACGYPYARFHKARLRLLAAPRYGAPHCEGARHRSVIAVRSSDPRDTLAAFQGAVAAINDPASNTGTNLLRHTLAELAHSASFLPGPFLPSPFLSAMICTGSHLASMRAVAIGEADLAAIDAVTFAAAEASYPGLAGDLRIIALSRSVPALPFVTARETPEPVAAMVKAALLAAMAAPELADARAALLLLGAEPVTPDAYDEVLELERLADAAGILKPN